MSDVLLKLEKDLLAIQKKFAGVDWKEKVNEIAAEFRRLGTEFSEQDKIRGFVLEFNGIDASAPRSHWPSVAFENEELVVKMSVSHLGKSASMKVEFSNSPASNASASGASTVKPATESVEDALDTLYPKSE